MTDICPRPGRSQVAPAGTLRKPATSRLPGYHPLAMLARRLCALPLPLSVGLLLALCVQCADGRPMLGAPPAVPGPGSLLDAVRRHYAGIRSVSASVREVTVNSGHTTRRRGEVLFSKPSRSMWLYDDGLTVRCDGPQCSSDNPQRTPSYTMTPVEQLSTAFFLDVSLSNVTWAWMSGSQTAGCGSLVGRMPATSGVRIVVFEVDTTTLDIVSVGWTYTNGDFRRFAFSTHDVDDRPYQPLERACTR